MAKLQEEVVEPSFSKGTLRRLLAYAGPYKKTIALCLLLALAVTALNLYRPILIGDAIDDYIEGYNIPYAYAEDGEIAYDGLTLTKSRAARADRWAVMVYYGERYYLVRELDTAGKDELTALTERRLEQVEETADGIAVTAPGGAVYEGELLSREALAALRSTDNGGIRRIALLYTLVLAATLVCHLAEVWLLQKTGQNIVYDIRRETFHHVHTLPLRFFDVNPVGRIVTRITNDAESLNRMYTQVLVKLFSNTVLLAGYAVVMVRINWRMALLCFAFLPVVFVLTVWFRTMIRRVYRVVRTRISALNTFLSENISGMRLIQIFAREKEKSEEFQGRTHELYRAQMREMLLFGLFRPGISFIGHFALALVLYRSGVSVLTGALTLGTLYIFTNYIRSFFEPIQELAEQFSTLQNALASAEKIFTVLDEKNHILEPAQPVTPERIRGKIEFRHVWFAYEGEEYVLRDVSFVIRPGEKVAFVGATGAGKSSILNLIGRYYDIQKGQILIDDVDIRDLSTRQIRRAVGQVQQDVFVFTGDIRSNIRLLDNGISQEAVERAAAAVNADRFIDRLPERYDEPVTERGSTLSAGERQLLSFARTLAYDPTILVMDEATANIDTETEQLIQGALEALMEGRTTIMVAHRLSTIQHADMIHVLHKGRLRESGTHQQLLQQDGIYKKLYELQQ